MTPLYHFSDSAERSETTKEIFNCDLLKNMSENIGKRLARLRRAADLMQKALGAQVKMSQGAIGNIETGTRGYGDSVVAIATALKTSPEYLLATTEDPTPRLQIVPVATNAQTELTFKPTEELPAALTPEAQHLARWFDRLPADSLAKLKVTQACLQLISSELQQENPPSHTPVAAATTKKQSA